MEETGLAKHIAAYGIWRQRLNDTIDSLRSWLREQGFNGVEVEQRLQQAQATLRDDKLYLAFIAEFSRGKSELINAIFFAQYGERILPSSAGRTTMSPTEIVYERGSEPCIRLLPIETRGNKDISLIEYKDLPNEWKTFELNTRSPRQMKEALHHLSEVKVVSRKQAENLNFHVAREETDEGVRVTQDGRVEIPRWRHAIINIPHPLLKQGLVILDTPGLNALGSEPELTLSMLPNAHGVLFILAADTGVTKSDIEVWRHHIGNTSTRANKGRLVALNKIDSMWDELRDWVDIQREVDQQVQRTAKLLGVSVHNIYPISAQKALQAKIQNDKKLLDKSRIMMLEEALAHEVLPEKRDIVRENVRADLLDVIEAMELVVQQRLQGVEEHLNELNSLNGKNIDVIGHMMEKVKADKEVFEESLQRFQAARHVFSKETNVLYKLLNLTALDARIAETRKNMETSMTTLGLRSSMQDFFSYVEKNMEDVARQSRDIKKMMDGMYAKFRSEHNLAKVKPVSFSVMRYMREISRLRDKNEYFIKGISLLMTEQGRVIRNFFDSSVTKVRAIYKMASRDADNWLKSIMSPMEAQVRERQILLRRRLESIKRIHQASDTLEKRISELEHVREEIHSQEKALKQRMDEVMKMLMPESSNRPPKAKAN